MDLRDRQAGRGKNSVPGLDEETQVLEHEQAGQIERDAERQKRASPRSRLRIGGDPAGGGPVAEARRDHQQHVKPFAPSIEEQAEDEERQILEGQCEVADEEERKKIEQEYRGRKNHGVPNSRLTSGR